MNAFDAQDSSVMEEELNRAFPQNKSVKRVGDYDTSCGGVARKIRVTNKEFDRLKYDRPSYKKLTEYLSKENIRSRYKIRSFLENEWIGRLNGGSKNLKS